MTLTRRDGHANAAEAAKVAVAHIEAILDTIRQPDHREDDPVPGRERFYRRDVDPRRWLRVVVDFNDSSAFVVTAFVQHHEPGSAP